jgi:transposase
MVLIRASFVPDADTQVLRNLLRTRKQLVRERSSHIQRLQKTLEDANIKLDSVVTDIIGMTGRAMLEALIVGETDPSKLAALAHPRIKAPPAQLREALRGRIMKHHRFLLRLHLQQIDAIDTAIAEIDREVNERIEPFRTTVELLTTIPGISLAVYLLTERQWDAARIGVVMSIATVAGIVAQTPAGAVVSTEAVPLADAEAGSSPSDAAIVFVGSKLIPRQVSARRDATRESGRSPVCPATTLYDFPFDVRHTDRPDDFQ